MAVTTVKCILRINDATGSGFSEIHYWQSGSETPSLPIRLGVMADQIAPARALLLSADCAVVGVSVSYPREGAPATLSKRIYIAGNQDQPGGAQEESLTMQWADVSGTRRKETHLRGTWDSIIVNGEYHPNNFGAADFETRLLNYKQLLIDTNFGWPSKDPTLSAKGNITNYTSSTDGRVTFVLGGDGMPVATEGKNVEVSISKLNNSQSALNTVLLVNVIDRNHIVTVKQTAAGPFAAPGRFNYRGPSFTRYGFMTSAFAGRRAQGRPFGQLPGRSRVRRRY